jgi:hypothetical protein
MSAELGFYRVGLNGGHVALTLPWLWIFRRRRSFGFYTTRYVRAANRASAEAQASRRQLSYRLSSSATVYNVARWGVTIDRTT